RGGDRRRAAGGAPGPGLLGAPPLRLRVDPRPPAPRIRDLWHAGPAGPGPGQQGQVPRRAGAQEAGAGPRAPGPVRARRGDLSLSPGPEPEERAIAAPLVPRGTTKAGSEAPAPYRP